VSTCVVKWKASIVYLLQLCMFRKRKVTRNENEGIIWWEEFTFCL